MHERVPRAQYKPKDSILINFLCSYQKREIQYQYQCSSVHWEKATTLYTLYGELSPSE